MQYIQKLIDKMFDYKIEAKFKMMRNPKHLGFLP